MVRTNRAIYNLYITSCLILNDYRKQNKQQIVANERIMNKTNFIYNKKKRK
jgi:hypothetical protein